MSPKLRKRRLNGFQVCCPSKLKLEPQACAKLTPCSSWEHAVYVTDDRSAPLHTARNKGREANAYLTYIIEHYDNLPETVAFIHSHLSSWHNDQNAAKALQLLNIDFVQKNGYANFRCHTTPGCNPAEIQPFRNKKEQAGIDKHEAATERAFAKAWTELFNSTAVPEQIGVACCAQFAVSRDQILQRPLAHYIWFHSWLMDTSLDDATAGRVMEYEPPDTRPVIQDANLFIIGIPGISSLVKSRSIAQKSISASETYMISGTFCRSSTAVICVVESAKECRYCIE